MIQKVEELEKWYRKKDPWGYEQSPEDKKRKEILLSEIPDRHYKRILDIGCGNGFITRDLPGENIVGIDISKRAILRAKKNRQNRIQYKIGSIFDLSHLIHDKYDLVVITGVLYPNYIGYSLNLIYELIDEVISDNGILVSVHIDQWYKARFPYLLLTQYFYNYKEYTHRLEIYVK